MIVNSYTIVALTMHVTTKWTVLLKVLLAESLWKGRILPYEWK